jgi:hypothetical protein
MENSTINYQLPEPISIPQPGKLPEIQPIHDPNAPKTYPEENPIEKPPIQPNEKPPFIVPKPPEFP